MVGEDSVLVFFVIYLWECSMVVSECVGVVFYGVVDGKNLDVFFVGEGSGIVINIGVVLFDDEGNFVLINCFLVNWKWFYLGFILLYFIVKYCVIGCWVIGGIVNVQVWFFLIY